MPGIFGYTKYRGNDQAYSDQRISLNIVSKEGLHKRNDFGNDSIVNTIVSYDFMKNYQLYYQIDNLDVWIFGDPLIDELTGEKAMDRSASLIAGAYPNFKSVSEIDGLFTIVVLDREKEKLFIIGDRNGLAHVYYGVFEGRLIWASELRAFIDKSIPTTIKPESIRDYLNGRYLIGDSTWFEEVKLLAPASYLEYSLNDPGSIQIKEYWTYKSLSPNSVRKDEKTVIKEMAVLFREAVERRVGPDERVGITLSGGLDSRAIFANIPFRKNGFTAITRGMKNCGDILIASQVTKLRPDSTHVIKEINETNWMDGRFEAIKATSGEKNIFDMNTISSLPIHKEYFDINLDGAGGDGIFGGGHLIFQNKDNIKKALRKKFFNDRLESYEDTLERFLDYYNLIDSDQYFYIHQRVRRFIVYGSILGHDYGVIARFPFLDHRLQEYIYQLSEDIDVGKVYNKMLIEYFPEYYVKIDNLRTGRRLFGNKTLSFIFSILVRAKGKLGIGKYMLRYHNYPKWLRENNRKVIDQYIFDQKLSIYNYVEYDEIKTIANDYLDNGNRTSMISRLITVSAFLESTK